MSSVSFFVFTHAGTNTDSDYGHVFVPACVYSKSSIVLGLAITVPLIVASLSVSLPIWVHNGYRFYLPPAWEHSTNGACETQARHGKSKEVSYTE